MLFNALSTVTLLLSAISGTEALRSARHGRGLESRHAHHVPANKRSFTFAANATAGEQIGKRRIESGAEGLDPAQETHSLGKRAYPNSRATFYAIGLGACGNYNHEPDFVVALNSAQYGGGYPGPECFKYITITGGPKNGHAVAQIVDECPTCPYGGLDMSIALFEQFATQDDGVASITWWYNDGSDAPAPAPEPTTSHTPTSTWVPPPSTSTTPAWTPPATTEQAPPSSSWTPSSTWVAPTTSSSVWVAPTTSSTSTWQAPSSSSSSTWSSSSSVWSSSSSSAPASSSSSSVGRVSAATVTNLVATSTRVTTASTSIRTAAPPTMSALSDDDESGDDSSVSVIENSNLDLLSTYTAQLGSLVVVAAQMVIA
ncbi:hypothetical protein NCC49_000583 [Naganishia albida]|nr:hypothetical protein NCC49_000583 [Naganishia albida]